MNVSRYIISMRTCFRLRFDWILKKFCNRLFKTPEESNIIRRDSAKWVRGACKEDYWNLVLSGDHNNTTFEENNQDPIFTRQNENA